MPLKQTSTTSTQPPKTVVDETEAAPASDATPGGEFSHGASESNDSLPASTTGGAIVNPSAPVVGGSGQRGDFTSASGKLAFGAFPQVKLDKDKFVVGDDTKNELDEFLFNPISSKSRWIYKRNKDEFFFSYDKEQTQDGRSVEAVLREWTAGGKSCESIREYQEVYGTILSEGEYKDRMVILSVPPASVPRFSAYIAELSLRRNPDNPEDRNDCLGPHQTVVKIQKGPKITTKAKDTFYPWDFRFHALLTDFQAPDEAE